MKGKTVDKQRLLHILEAIIEIEQYTTGANVDDFVRNSMMRFASVKQIEIIGEAANYVSEETKGKFPNVEWRQIVALRHVLVHEYFGIDNQLIWQIIDSDLPKLRRVLNWFFHLLIRNNHYCQLRVGGQGLN